jgi:hypothetical protein
MSIWRRLASASVGERGASRRAFLRNVGGATAAVVGAQVVDLPGLLSGQGPRTAAAYPVGAATRAAHAAGAPIAAVADSAAGGASSVLARVLPTFPAPWPGQTPIETLTLDVFGAHLDTPFRAHHVAGVLDLVLTQATPNARQDTDAQDNFALLFRGPSGHRLEQGTYKLTHEALGAFDLFIVPVGKATDAQHYEAIFNRSIA